MRSMLPLFLCLVAAGCVNTSVRLLDNAPRPARSPESVAVMSEEPEQPYAVIAVVKSSSSAVFDSFDDLREQLVSAAARLGGDALILGAESKTSTPIFNTVGFVMSERKELQGDVIVLERGRY